jgi:hypothetical protein
MHWKLVTGGARAGAVVVLLGLAGCFTAYKAPETGPVAKVRIQIESDDYFVIVDAWKHGVCSTTERIGLVGASPRFVTATTEEAERSKARHAWRNERGCAETVRERVVPADRPFSPAFASSPWAATRCLRIGFHNLQRNHHIHASARRRVRDLAYGGRQGLLSSRCQRAAGCRRWRQPNSGSRLPTAAEELPVSSTARFGH